MARKYIKSHSNYVIKQKHQNTTGGTVFERDITTIGGRNQFSKGQVPIYQSGNFVITVNNEDSVYKKVNEGEWYKSEFGDIWTKEIVDTFDMNYETSDDTKIEVKKDFHDLRDYAYYGSCSEMIRASINDILAKYPGELYIPDKKTWVVGNVEYTDKASANEAADNLGLDWNEDLYYMGLRRGYHEYSDEENEVNSLQPKRVWKRFKLQTNENLALVDNPFNINIFFRSVPEFEYNPLKYWANGGSDNYCAYLKDEKGEWDFDNPYDILYEVVFNGEDIEAKINFEVGNLDADGKINLCNGGVYKIGIASEKVYEVTGTETNTTLCSGDYVGYVVLYFTNSSSEFGVTPEKLKFDGSGSPEDKANDGFFHVNDQIITTQGGPYYIYLFVGDDGDILYFVNADDEENFNYRIRPKKEKIEEFFDNLDLFEKILLNRKTEPIYTASFEVISENDFGQYMHTEHFTFPTTHGGYNLGSYGVAFDNYLSSLSHIAEFYDTNFSDNLWRSMTHEAIKNFDWTFTRRFAEDEDKPFVEGGQKIQKVIRLFGRQFDELKNYIDPIATANKVTYDGIENIPDYFLSDKLEETGWDVKLIYPLNLKEYVDGNTSMPYDFHTDNDNFAEDEKRNKSTLGNSGYEVDITRIFTQEYESQYCAPYYAEEKVASSGSNKFILSQSSIEFDCSGNEEIIIGASISDTTNPDCFSGETIYYYSDGMAYSYFDVNTEFFRRLTLNSRYIMRHKGTVESIEMVMALFNMKKGHDYDIEEYTVFSPYETDTWDDLINDFKVDWINSTKTIQYNTDAFREGRYIPYQGLPVSYRDMESIENDLPQRRLYPYFNSEAQYDGNMYYQMKGGWLMKKPFMFDMKNNIIPEGYGSSERTNRLFTESIKNIKCVQTLQELLDTPSLAVNNGDIVQVMDLSGTFAVVDGTLYTLFREAEQEAIVADVSEEYYYFYAPVYNNTLTVGNAVFTDYVIISNPYYTNQRQRVELSDDYYNNREVKIYVIKKTELGTDSYTYEVNISSNNSTISTFTVFEDGKYMEGDNFTNYFRINDTNFYNELSFFGWQQLRSDDYDYYALNAIIETNEGNNPHTGHMDYDNGHEYLYRFKKLFKHALENDLFDYRRYDSHTYDILNDMDKFGFSNLVNDDACNKDYDDNLIKDSKCHYFGDFIRKSDEGQNVEYRYMIDKVDGDGDYESYDFTALSTTEGERCYGYKFLKGVDKRDIDGVTDQIVNTKRCKITIFIDEEQEYTIPYLEKVKYYDSVVMHYVTQMLPSTIICTVEYKLKPPKKTEGETNG